MASPERLLSSTARLIGEAGIRARWGGMAPVPQDNLHALSGGERILDGAFRVAYTPGHAVHHVAYLHEESGWALAGDVAGVRVMPEATVIAPTPPPDVDLAAWPASLRALRDWEPRRLCLSHSGAVTDVGPHLEALEESLALQADRARELEADAFTAWYTRHLDERMAPEVRALYLEASPVEHMWRGLRRWHEKRARRDGAR
jgi:glyoxylase-like metal-dependent hydrolase (beta-lactamase superfamily II)